MDVIYQTGDEDYDHRSACLVEWHELLGVSLGHRLVGTMYCDICLRNLSPVYRPWHR